MKTTGFYRPAALVLLALCSLAPRAAADEPLVPPQVPAPGSVAELFDPAARPAAPPVPPSSPAPAPPTPGPPGPLVSPQPAAPHSTDSGLFVGMRQGDRERRKLKNSSELDWGFVTSEFIWRAPEPGYDSPFERGEWSTEDLVAIPVTGPIFLFGEVVMGGEYAADQEMKVVGRTGVLWKMPVGDGSAIELRGGPSVKYLDALRQERSRDQAAVLWEVKAKAPLLGPVGLEYLGEAQPAVTPEDSSQILSDLALFLPVSGGKVKLGARHRWDPNNQQEVRSATGMMQFYLGIEIGR